MVVLCLMCTCSEMWIEILKKEEVKEREKKRRDKKQSKAKETEKTRKRSFGDDHMLYYSIQEQDLVLLALCSLTCIFSSCSLIVP